MHQRLENFSMLIILCVLSFLSGLITQKYPLIRYIISIGVTIILYHLYTRIRNHYIHKKSYMLLYGNQFDECLSFLNSVMDKYPNFIWLKYNKLDALFMSGRLSEYERYLDEFEIQNEYLANTGGYAVTLVRIILNFIRGQKKEYQINITKQAFDSEKLAWIILNKDTMTPEEIIGACLKPHETNYYLFKSISSLILAEAYRELNQTSNYALFAEKAQCYAPSDEVRRYVRKHLDTSVNT